MSRRIIASILVFSLLGYDTALACDAHAFDLAAHADADAHTRSGPADADGGCDHCCHAASHLVGLAPQRTTASGAHPERFQISADTAAVRLAACPPAKPPRS